ncbi:S10 family peptidase [Francisellaceae bacterium]|nr:S10 family peptidase [Francisellaceae bacterium]
MIEQLQWPERHTYKKSLQQVERVEDQVIGYMKSGGGLSWFNVLNAGHPVPQDQPLIYSAVQSFVKQ